MGAGIGPKLVITGLFYFILASFLSAQFPKGFTLNFIPQVAVRCIGVTLLLIGIVFFINTQIVFIREFHKGKLITTGTYSLCRNPIYATFILFIIPAIALLVNSWLLITASILVYAVFKVNIGKEYDYLREKFGDEYIEYEKRVSELFPFPKGKMSQH